MEDSSIYELELVLLLALVRRQKKRNRRMWVRPIFRLRKQQGEYHNLLQEMRLSDPDSHFKYLRMSKERFDSLLAEVHYIKSSFWLVFVLMTSSFNEIF